MREKPLIGEGEYRSPILVIGPAVRERDNKENQIFSGRAKVKLTRMLEEAGLSLDKVYITYLVRCYGGREPPYGEFSAFRRCQDHTIQLMKIMKPLSVVVCGFKVFKWLILRWTGESADESTFYHWVGRSIRLKEVWGDLKFFVIESPAELSRARNPESEAKSIDLLKTMKEFVVAQQKKEPIALDMFDLIRRKSRSEDQQTFGWC